MNPKAFLIHSWDQGGFLGALDFYANCHGVLAQDKLDIGMCQTLSLKWIKLKLKEVQQHQRADSARRMSQMTDSLFEAASIQAKEKAPFASEAIKFYQLKELILTNVNLNAESIAAKVTHAKRSCYMLIFQPNDEYGNMSEAKHAIAMYQSSGKIFGINRHVYIFDPNEGEYKVGSNSFRNWIEAFLSEYYNIPKGAIRFGDLYLYSLQ